MPVLQLDDQQYPLPAGPLRIGSGPDADVVLPCDASLGVQAIVEHTGENILVVRRATPSALVRVNGVVLGAEPTPLIHGDKVEVGGLELRFAEDARGGVTQFMSSAAMAALGGARRSGSARETVASGGRVISLVDGKEYEVPDTGVVIGRDASCDIVVAQNEVSRRHAEILPGEGGYVVRDVSANGVLVNGERVQGSHRLMRSDVLCIGTEEFRFYADVTSSAAAAGPSPSHGHGPELVPKIFDSLPTAPTARQSGATRVVHAGGAAESPQAAATAYDLPPVLATLELLDVGPTQGTRQPLRMPVVQVGRGPQNDVQLPDESVSDVHARLHRRADGWYLVDLDSTNGSFVDGERVRGEQRLDGSPELRFGSALLRFSPAGAEPRRAGAETPTSRGGVPAWVWILAAVAIAAAAFFVSKGIA